MMLTARLFSLALSTSLIGQAPASKPAEPVKPAAATAKPADAPVAKPVPKAPLAKLELQDGDSIVFLGDSITHQVLYTQYVEDYFYTRFPKLRLKFHNAGVGGARAWDALARFDRDVAAYKPKYVTILLGMNDGTYKPFDEPTFQTYKTDMNEVLKKITDIGATPILMTPTMYDARAARKNDRPFPTPEGVTHYNGTLAYYGAWLRDTAVENGWGFVDMYGPLNTITLEQRKTDPTFTLIKDAVHPDAPGQLIMASAIINDVAPSRRVSAIHVAVMGDKAREAGKQQGGTLTELMGSPSTIEFTWLADSLPWVVPTEAQLGVDLAKIGHKLGSESLAVSGLAPGKYSLTIDDVEVGVYTADALARHVELQGNSKTPQYQQALAVAELNKKRNEGPVRGKRNAWGGFQGYARTKLEAGKRLWDPAVAKKLADMEPKMADLDERVAKLNEEAKALEDEIYTKNQPKARKYVLKKVDANATAKAGN